MSHHSWHSIVPRQVTPTVGASGRVAILPERMSVTSVTNPPCGNADQAILMSISPIRNLRALRCPVLPTIFPCEEDLRISASRRKSRQGCRLSDLSTGRRIVRAKCEAERGRQQLFHSRGSGGPPGTGPFAAPEGEVCICDLPGKPFVRYLFWTFPGRGRLVQQRNPPGFNQGIVNTDGSTGTIHPFRIGPNSSDECPLTPDISDLASAFSLKRLRGAPIRCRPITLSFRRT